MIDQDHVLAVFLNGWDTTTTPAQKKQFLEAIGAAKMESPSHRQYDPFLMHEFCTQVQKLLNACQPTWAGRLLPSDKSTTGEATIKVMTEALVELNTRRVTTVYVTESDEFYKALLLEVETSVVKKTAPVGCSDEALGVDLDDEDEDEDEDDFDDAPPASKQLHVKKSSAKRKSVQPPATPTDSIALVLEAWDHGQFNIGYLKANGYFPPVSKALTDVLTWLTYNHTVLKYPQVNVPQKPVADVPALNPINAALAKFYSVGSDQEVIEAQSRQVQKLQDRVAMLERAPTVVRAGRR